MTHPHQYEYGVSDLIQATAMVDDGIVALKDGGLLAGWRYTGTSDMEAAGVVRDRLAAVLDHGKGWVFETNAIRLPSTIYPAWGEFPDPVSRLIEAERIRNYAQLIRQSKIDTGKEFDDKGRYFSTQYFMTLSYFPPSNVGEKAKGWFYETPESKGFADDSLDHFRKTIDTFESICSGFLQLKRLQSEGEFDNFLRYIQFCITGEDRLFLKPDSPVDLDFLLGGVDLHCGTKPLLDGKQLRVLAIDPMPRAIFPAMLNALEQLPIAFRLNGRAILLDRMEAAQIHEDNETHHGSKMHKFSRKTLSPNNLGKANKRAYNLSDEAGDAAAISEDHAESWAHYSSRIILIRDTEAEMAEAIDTIRSCAEGAHLKIRIETLNVTDAWCGSLPGHAFFDLRQVPLRAFNIAGMSPLHAPWTGEKYHPSPKMPPHSSPLLVATGEGQTPYCHNLHVQDVGHTAVFGPTGNGKTTIFGLHAAALLRYPGAQVVMFDRNRTQYVLCRAVGGRFYDFGDKSLELCPLKHLDSPAELAWAGNYIELLCSMNGLTITATHTDRIGKALERFSRSKHRSLTHFAGAVGDTDIQAALQFYTIGNPVSARLLDGEDESIADSHFTVFEMAELMQMNRRISMAVQMHLFRRIERKLNPARITGIFLDEARRMIGDDIFAAAIENWLKEIRNLNGFVMLALQEIEDGQGSKLRSVIEQQCKTKIFLPNAAAKADHTKAAYTALGLTAAQIQQVILGRAKHDYFISTPDHWSKISFDIEQVALAFLSANTPADRALVDRLIADNPETWQSDFLRSRGLHEWADYLKEV